MHWAVLLSVVLVLQYPLPLAGYGEPDASGHPVYQERANHLFLNAVRIAPSQYKTVYMAGYSPSPSAILGTTYPAVAPVYMEPRLVSSAYYHSNDMAVNGCFQHDSCNGTATFTRIRGFYSCSGTMGENIAAGYSSALDTSNQWLCDKVGTACAADGSGSDGHRSNMMSASYKAVGVGYAYTTSSYRYYWTQDFGGAACSPVPTNPIYSGSHLVSGTSIKFIGIYYTNPAVAPASASVTIGGTSYALTLDIGAAGQATYAYTGTTGTACRYYYFTIGSSRYPDTGCLATYGEGSCTTSYNAACTSSTAAATTAASVTTASAAATTTAAVTTAAVTTAAVTTAAAASGTTGATGTYYLFSTSLQNSWVFQKSTGVTLINPGTYSSQTCFSAYLEASSNNFFWLAHTPSVTNVWTTLQFYAATTATGTLEVFFNGYYYQLLTVTPTWQRFTVTLSSLGAPASLGNPQLVFMNAGTTSYTAYFYNIAFL